MWDSQTGIEVRIHPFGCKDPYQEYKAKSTSELYAGDRNECYIEAVDDERYSVEVVIPAFFPWEKAPYLSLTYNLDGGMITQSDTFKRPKEREAITDQASEFTACIDGAYKVCGFTFGPAAMTDDPTFLTQDEEDAELSARGKIEVNLQRGKETTRKMTKKEMRIDQATDPRETFFLHSETNKKVAGDNGRSHYTRALVLEPVSAKDTASEVWSYWTPAEGEAGQEIALTFYYTTKDYLERKNIVSMITYPTSRENAIDVEEYIPGQLAPDRAASQATPVTVSPESTQSAADSPRSSVEDGVDEAITSTGNKRIKIEGHTDDDLTTSAQVSGCNNGFHQSSGCNGGRPDCNVTHDRNDNEPLPRKRTAVQAARADVSERDMYSATPGSSGSSFLQLSQPFLRETVSTEAADFSDMGKQPSSDDDDDDQANGDTGSASLRALANTSSVRSTAGRPLTQREKEERRAQIADELREIELRRRLRALDEI